MSLQSLITRYDAGDHVAVWDELHGIASILDLSDSDQDAVRKIAQKTMERAAFDLRTVAERLARGGYPFQTSVYLDKVRKEPILTDGEPARLELEGIFGPIPVALDEFLRQVGLVNLRIDDNFLTSEFRPDSFEFIADAECIRMDVEAIEDQNASGFLRPLSFNFAGDLYHKTGYSGSSASRILLPSNEPDARVVEIEDDSNTPVASELWFVDYLRLYLPTGGFRLAGRNRTYPPGFDERLADGLLAF